MLPDGWKVVSLETVASIERGRFSVRPRNDPKYYDGHMPFVQTGDISSVNGVLKKYSQTLNEQGLTVSKVFPAKTILLTIAANIGDVAITAFEVACPDSIVGIQVNEQADALWLLYFLKTQKDYLDSRATQNAQKNINLQTLKPLLVKLPPIPEQKKIAAILNSVDEAIASTQAVIDQTSKVKQGLLQQLLTHGIGHTKFKDTAIGKIPESWGVCSVDELGIFSSGHGFKPEDWSDSGLPIIRIQNLNGSQDFNYYAGIPEQKWIVNPGDLLFAWAGVKGVSFGPCIWSGSVSVLNQHIYRIQPKAGVDKHWLFWTLEEITKKIEGHAHGFKYSLLHVRKGDIVEQIVPFPPFEEQQRIAEKLGMISEHEAKHQSSLDRLKKLKCGLMQDLLTGRVRVKGA